LTEVKNCALKPYFYILLHGFSIQTCVTTSLVYTCKRICQTAARKARNQRNTNSSVLISYLEANSGALTV